MNTKSRRYTAWALSLVWLALAAVAMTSPAVAADQSLKDKLLGHWQLVSVSVHNTNPYGTNPQGSMFLDASGHFSVIVISDAQARSIAYFGTYTLDESAGTLNVHIEGSSGNAAGRDMTRFLTLDGDQLTVESQKDPGPIGSVKLTWKRAN